MNTVKPRFEVRAHRTNREFDHVGGFAAWDRIEKKQVGWCRHIERAQQSVDERNAAEANETIGETAAAS